jgi:hypothetical protein
MIKGIKNSSLLKSLSNALELLDQFFYNLIKIKRSELEKSVNWRCLFKMRIYDDKIKLTSDL